MSIVSVNCTGIEQTTRGHLTVGHGGLCIAIIECTPQLGTPPANVSIGFSDGFTSLTLNDCRIDRASMAFTTNGHVVRVQVLGPTWRMDLAAVDGQYNIPQPDGTVKNPRTVRELGTILFQAMRWPSFDVSALPAIDGPYVNWKGASARAELTALCHDWGCDFVLDLFNPPMVRVVRLGFGPDLPGGFERSVQMSVDVAEIPDGLRVYCGDTVFQSKLKLRAVLPEIETGAIVPIDDWSGRPAGGWESVDPHDPFPDEDDTKKAAIANQYLYRLWEPYQQADGTEDVPLFGPATMERLVPILPRLAKAVETSTGLMEAEPFLEGTYELQGEPLPLKNSGDFDYLDVPFRIVDGRFILTSVPVVKLDDDDRRTEADLYLTCAYGVSHEVHETKAYHSLRRELANNGTGDVAVHRPDLQRRIIGEYSDDRLTGVVDNIEALNAVLNAVLDAAASEYQTVKAKVVHYNGIVAVSPSGTVRQVTIQAATNGAGKGIYTVAAVNTEWEPGIERRRRRREKAEAERSRRSLARRRDR